MKTIVFLQGIPGAGKSTFIKEHGLEPYTLSPDIFRMMLSSIEMREHSYSISQKQNEQVFKYLHSILEERMSSGAFTVIDATNCAKKSIDGFKELIKKHGYRTYVVKFDISPDVAKERDKTRGYKMAGESVIDRMYENLQNFEYKSWYTVISPEEYDSIVPQQWTENEYKRIVHIGDIHGCYSALSQITFEDDTQYIFMGDYFDRGIENGKTAKLLMELMNKPNMVFLYGNHERHIEEYLSSGNIKSKEFKKSIEDIHANGVTNSDLKKFMKKVAYYHTYRYGTKDILCTHGGLSLEPDDIRKIDPKQCFWGVGDYDFNVDEAFVPKNKNFYQIHGHRNKFHLPIFAGPNSFNLNSTIEGGEALRTLVLDETGFHAEEFINPVYNEEFNPLTNVYYRMMNDSDITSKDFGEIVSFNFSRDTFWEKRWTEDTILARGLFCDKTSKKVVARGYEKFFEAGENATTSMDVLKELEYPLTAYRKENGYLGILGIHKGEFLFCSKSSLKSDFAKWFKEIFYATVNDTDELKNFMSSNNLGMVFEVIDSVNDTHIINYGKETKKVVLLDMFKLDYKFEHLPYTELQEIATKFGLICKTKVNEFKTFDEVESFINEVSKYDYTENGFNVEGYVVEDSSQQVFHFKLKTGYYKFWKIVRNGIERDNFAENPEKLYQNLVYAGLESENSRMDNIVKKYISFETNPSLFELQ